MVNDPEMPAELAEVARRCREETDRFFHRLAHDTRYCYELFRRALTRREADAFALLMRNYTDLADGWVRRHPSFPRSGEDSSYFVTIAFEKMWMAIPPARFSRFPDLKSLLRYLQLCVHSVVVDHIRFAERVISLDGLSEDSLLHEPVAPEPSHSYPDRTEIWQTVMSRLQTEKERVVLYACYGLAMKPADIPSAYPEVFASVQEVYRTKQNVLERLRRDQTLRKLLTPYA